MTIRNFIPELWSPAVQVPYRKALVFGQSPIVNRDYEGTIRQQGDTVHVTTIDDPTVNDYDKTTDIEIEDLDDARITMVIDQGKYFAFRMNDVDRVQAAGNFDLPALQAAGFKLRDHTDTFIAEKFVDPATGTNAGGPVAGNRLGALTVIDDEPQNATVGQISAYQVLVKLREKLDARSVPLEGRYVVVSPSFVSALLMDKRYTDLSASGSTSALLQGQVGYATGFAVLVSNNLPKQGEAVTLCAGTPGAISFADQILETEALREGRRFADVVRGLNVFGGKVFRREGLATATVTMAPATSGSAGGSGE